MENECSSEPRGQTPATPASIKSKKSPEKDSPLLVHILAQNFDPKCRLISQGKNSAAKKLNMLLRWLVRDNSPVDLGLWSNWYSKTDLLMPLDTHVVQEATKIGLFPKTARGDRPLSSIMNRGDRLGAVGDRPGAVSDKPKNPTLKTAQALTQTLKEAFPEDPLKADFALFGLGVDNSE